MKDMIDAVVLNSPEYRQFIEDLQARVVSARNAAARHVNRDLILLSWDIGRGIVEQQARHAWGDSVVEMVAADLRRAFPRITGFSPRNVWDMRRMFAAYTSPEFLAELDRESGRQRGNQPLPQPVAETDESERLMEILP